MIVAGRAIPKRTCDKCGALRDVAPGVFRVIAKRWICNWHDYYVAQEKLDRLPYQTFPVRPFKDAKPFNPRDSFERAEMELFAFVTENYTTAYVDVTGGAGAADTTLSAVPGAAWTAIYLYHFITEAKRPTRFISLAKTKLREIADWLLDQQVAAPQDANGLTDDDARWGAFNALATASLVGQFPAADAGAAGLALLRAYQVHGTDAYLQAARAAAWFVRTCQSGGRLAADFASSDSAGSSAVNRGAFTQFFSSDNVGAPLADHRYLPSSLVCLEFLQAFKDVAGDEAIGSSVTGTGFSSSREALVSTCIAEAIAFWTSGTHDVTQGETITGLSTATPFDRFNSYPATKSIYDTAGGADTVTGTGSWEYSDGVAATGTKITALGWAVGLRGLQAAGQSVTPLFDWLMAFSSNDDHELPATTALRMISGYSDKTKWGGVAGNYDPKTALATDLLVREDSEDVTKNGSSLYDLATAGILASLYAARQPAAFKALKEALNEPRPRSRGGLQDGSYLWLGLLGRSGLSFQPYTDASLNRRQTVEHAAMLGLIYRQAPQAFASIGGGT